VQLNASRAPQAFCKLADKSRTSWLASLADMQVMPALLLFHGLDATPRELFELQALAQTLRRDGLEVVLPRLPALDVRDAQVLPFEQWLDRARDHYDALARQHGDAVVAGGLGSGALQALALGLQRRPAGLLLLSPRLHLRELRAPLVRCLRRDAKAAPVAALLQTWRLQRYLRPHLQDVRAPILRLDQTGAEQTLDLLRLQFPAQPLAA